MKSTKVHSEVVLKTAAAVLACTLLMTIVKTMNQEGFEERFGCDSQRLPDFGMSEAEIDACHLKSMIDWFGLMHHHGW